MKKISFLLLIFPLVAFGQKIELAIDWIPNPTDQKVFEQPFFCTIKQKALEKNFEIVAVDLNKYKLQLKVPKKKSNWTKIKDLVGMKPKKVLADDVAYLMLWNMSDNFIRYDFSRLPKEKLVLFMWEPPSVEPHIYDKKFHECFSKIYTWDDSLVDNQKYFKFYYPVLPKMREDIPEYKDKKLCTLISSKAHSNHPNELYSKREEMIQFFDKLGTDDFEFYGRKWEGCPYKCYRGEVADKGAVLKNYRFNICYENIHQIQGYITEKIFDAFASGCVPVYLGASNITDYIPEGCFIDRRKFQSNEELYEFLKNMGKEEYDAYLENIRAFLASEKAQVFSLENFFRIFTSSI